MVCSMVRGVENGVWCGSAGYRALQKDSPIETTGERKVSTIASAETARRGTLQKLVPISIMETLEETHFKHNDEFPGAAVQTEISV